MISRIMWKLLSAVDALLHYREYYDEAMEYRVQLFSQVCLYCRETYPTGAKFCPQCGEEILSEEAQIAEAWAERQREREVVYH